MKGRFVEKKGYGFIRFPHRFSLFVPHWVIDNPEYPAKHRDEKDIEDIDGNADFIVVIDPIEGDDRQGNAPDKREDGKTQDDRTNNHEYLG